MRRIHAVAAMGVFVMLSGTASWRALASAHRMQDRLAMELRWAC
jgi:hypothetical protein